MLATAAPATMWLLVEQPGAWGRHALRQSQFAPEVAARLLDMGTERGIRVQAIRRPPDRAHPDRPRRWAYVDSRVQSPPTSWWGEYTDDDELLDLALDGSQGSRSTHPIYLVCTHARHDACCALFGRPVYGEVARLHPDQTWETSHVGGDRFAANLVILPEGLYYGGLEGDSAHHVVDAHGGGLIDLDYFRGRSAHPVPAQAAEHYLREHLGEHRITALAVISVHQLELNRWVTRLSHLDDAEFDVEVSSTHSPALHRLTCSATHPAAARQFDLVSLREVDPA